MSFHNELFALSGICFSVFYKSVLAYLNLSLAPQNFHRCCVSGSRIPRWLWGPLEAFEKLKSPKLSDTKISWMIILELFKSSTFLLEVRQDFHPHHPASHQCHRQGSQFRGERERERETPCGERDLIAPVTPSIILNTAQCSILFIDTPQCSFIKSYSKLIDSLKIRFYSSFRKVFSAPFISFFVFIVVYSIYICISFQ